MPDAQTFFQCDVTISLLVNTMAQDTTIVSVLQYNTNVFYGISHMLIQMPTCPPRVKLNWQTIDNMGSNSCWMVVIWISVVLLVGYSTPLFHFGGMDVRWRHGIDGGFGRLLVVLLVWLYCVRSLFAQPKSTNYGLFAVLQLLLLLMLPLLLLWNGCHLVVDFPGDNFCWFCWKLVLSSIAHWYCCINHMSVCPSLSICMAYCL